MNVILSQHSPEADECHVHMGAANSKISNEHMFVEPESKRSHNTTLPQAKY